MRRDWPVLRRYKGDRLRKIALPLGGIGTGTVSLGGRGELKDWEVMNRPAKGFHGVTNEFNRLAPFFALFTRTADGRTATRALEGCIDEADYDGYWGSPAPNGGLPRFRSCAFAAAYPLGQVTLRDDAVPLEITLQAFNPLIPGDADGSGIPAAVLRYVLRNPTDRPVTASVCANMQNFIGYDGLYGAAKDNRNELRGEGEAVRGVFMRTDGIDCEAEQYGTMAVAVMPDAAWTNPDAAGTAWAAAGADGRSPVLTCRTAWTGKKWGDALADFWEDFSAAGTLEEREPGEADAPMCSLAYRIDIAAGQSAAVTFLIAWHFPNRQSWDGTLTHPRLPVKRIGNYYATQYKDAWDVVVRTAGDLHRLEERTVAFVSAFCESDFPDAVKEAALFNISTLRTQTCFRAADGRFFGWEGCFDQVGCCHGSANHVWNYEQTLAFLFGELSLGMREVELMHACADNGMIHIRVELPLSAGREPFGLAAADGQMGCLMKLYRDWQLSGDDAMLRALWPNARKALEFAWIPGGWDADRDGVMEGCQHTIDVEYYGPNPLAGVWYLGALRAMAEMAAYVGETAFADRCLALFRSGSRYMDSRLFNGEYYEHEIRPISDPSHIAPGLRHASLGADNAADPDFQLGAGCLIDQLVGQWMARVCGLGDLLDPGRVRTTLRSIMKYNWKETMRDHFNPMRTFALNDEPAVVMCTYPLGRRPAKPFPYEHEVMNGFEYVLGAHLLFEGMAEEGVRVFDAVRRRYDGKKRNPFNEPECGHHYARSLAGWSGVPALSGFRFSAVEQSVEWKAATDECRMFWSNGYAWGTLHQLPAPDAVTVTLSVLSGRLAFRRCTLSGVGVRRFDDVQELEAGQTIAIAFTYKQI